MHEIIRKLQFWKEPCALHKVRTVKILSNEFVDSGKLQNFTGISDESNLHDLETKGYFDETAIKKKVGGTGNCQWSQRGIRLTLE